MPFLPVDIDGKRRAHGIERALGLPRHAVAGGLNDLWEVVWRDKSPVVDELTLDEAFGTDPRIRLALVARGFLEPVEGGHRVKGAAKWLFGLEGKRRGGQASKGNLVPGPKPKGSAEGPAEPKPIPSASAEAKPEPTFGSPSALTPRSPEAQKPLEEVPQADFPQPTDPLRAMSSDVVPALVALAKPDRRKAADPDNVFRLQEQRANEPPKLSKQQEFAFYFWQCRHEHIAEAGLPPSDDTGWPIVVQNKRLGFVKQQPEELLAHAVRAYLDNEKMRDKDPPWPLHFFVQDFGRYESVARKRVAR